MIINSYRYAGGAGYLLDTYTGAAAAYSLRQLKTGVTSVVRVRRSSDNVEADFTPTEITDGTLTTWTGLNDGYVTKWYDQSGNGTDLAQTTASNQFGIVVSGSLILDSTTGLPSIKVLDGNGYMLTSYDLTLSVNGWNSFTVVNTGSLDASLPSFGWSLGNGDNPLTERCGQLGFGSTANLSVNTSMQGGNALFNSSNNYITTNETILSGINFKSGAQAQYVNGTLAGSNTVTLSEYTSRPHRIVLSHLEWSLVLTTFTLVGGLYSELVVFGSDKSSERAAIETSINNYYGIY